MDWSWAVSGITNETPRTTGPECQNYMTNRRRWIEAVFFNILFVYVIMRTMKHMEPIRVPDAKERDKPHSAIRLLLLLLMTFIFGIEMGFKLANSSLIFVLNPCHIQTIVQIYILAAKPSKLTISLFRIQMNNFNGPFLAYIFPEVTGRTLPFEQASYWIQHALLYIIPIYILRTGAYQVEDIKDYNWCILGVELQLIYHFTVLNYFSILTGINLNHMLCAAESDPFQGDNYRIAAVIHESILCPILNKVTVLIFSTPQSIQRSTKRTNTATTPTTTTTTTNMQKSLDEISYQQQEHSKLTTLQQQQQQQQSLISEIRYFPEDTSSQLIHRNIIKTNPVDYHLQSQQEQHLHQQHQHHPHQLPHQHPHEEQDEAVFQGDYNMLDPNDMEIIEPSKTTITAEYTMPTTKID